MIVKKRIHWIDWAKFIGIWLVIIGHAPIIGGIFIYMFHMPMFFMISGFLYNKTNLGNELKKSFKSLIIPYLIYNGFLIVSSIIIGDFRIGIINHIILGNQEGIGLRYFNPLWFIVSLFVMRVLLSIFNEKNMIHICILCILFSIVLYHYDCFSYDNNPYQISTTLICLPFFITGHLIRNKNLIINLRELPTPKKIYCHIAIIIAIIVAVCAGYINGVVNIFRAPSAGNSIIVFYFVGFVLSYSIIILIASIFNCYNTFIETISNGTILILCTHQLVIVQINNYFPLNTITSLILSIGILVIYYFLIKYSCKYCPTLIGKN